MKKDRFVRQARLPKAAYDATYDLKEVLGKYKKKPEKKEEKEHGNL